MSYTADEILFKGIFCAGGDIDLFYENFYPEFYLSLFRGNENFNHMTKQKIYAQEVLRLNERDTQDFLNCDPICGFHVNFAPYGNFDAEYFTAYMTGKPCPDAELHFRRLDMRGIRYALRNPDNFIVKLEREETFKALGYIPDYLALAKERNRAFNNRTTV